MTAFNSDNDKAVEKVEVDGIGFETVVSQKIVTLPKKDVIQKLRYLFLATLSLNSFQYPCPFITVAIGLRITNNTTIARLFSRHSTLFPELIGVEGAVPNGGGWISPNCPTLSDFVNIQPGQSTTFFPEAAIFWQWGNQFVLSIDSGNGGSWDFEPIKPGSYQVRFLYHNTRREETVYDTSCQEFKLIENIWMGEVSTPFVEFQIVRA